MGEKMTFDELEEMLGEFLADYCSYEITTDKKGRIVIKTSLAKDDDGDLYDQEESFEESEFSDEEGFESYEEDEDEDDEE